MKKVGITGMSLMSIQGINKSAHSVNFSSNGKLRSCFNNQYWDNYFDGKAGRIPDFNPKIYLKNPKSIKFMSRHTIIGSVAALQAIQDSAFAENEFQENEYQNALIFGASVSDNSIFPLLPAILDCIDSEGNIDYKKVGIEGYRNLPPLWILSKLPNTTTGQISVQNSIRGLSYTVLGGPLNGIISISKGFDLLEKQRANCVICGSAESYTHADYICMLCENNVISLTEKGLMPFDESSDGSYLAEGASVFVLENEETALRRGARIYARILSYNNSYLPFLTNGNNDRLASRLEKCMQAALERAGLSEKDIHLIQANAYGDKRLDIPEAMAIKNIFGKNVPITSCANYTGYTLGASGAISVAFAIMQMENNCILPIGRTHKYYLEKDINYIRDNLFHRKIQNVLINSFSHTGDVCSMILARGGI